MIRKILLGVGILIVAVLLFLVFGRQYYTKRFSPEGHVELKTDNLEILVFYNRPFKRGREIFGSLVPYGKVWRTGANEATWFETNRDLSFAGQILKPGRYSLWTIPNDKSWKVIFNSSIPPWGVDYNSEAAHNPNTDVLVMDIPAELSDQVIEQFTITLSQHNADYQLNLLWDRTIVSVPFKLNAPSDK